MRDTTAFPDASGDAGKLAEQLKIAYISALVVLANLPDTEQTITTSPALTPYVYQTSYKALPSGRFFALPNSGIRRIILDSQKIALSKAQPRAYVEAIVGNRFQANSDIFAFDESLNYLITPSSKEVKVEYVALPAEPSIGTETFPLVNPHIQRAAELVMARVYGYQQDAYYQQFHQVWSKIYGLNQVEVSE